jgi:hypothetical protein
LSETKIKTVAEWREPFTKNSNEENTDSRKSRPINESIVLLFGDKPKPCHEKSAIG